MKKMCIVLFLCLAFLSACSHRKENQVLDDKSSKNQVVSSSATRDELLASDTIADQFVKVYIAQEFDMSKLDKKQQELQEFAGDSSLDIALSDLTALKAELSDYQKTKTIRTSASVTLVERELFDFEIYKNGAKYFVDVRYKESSPAFEGTFERRKQYTFKIDNGKIIQFEEVI